MKTLLSLLTITLVLLSNVSNAAMVYRDKGMLFDEEQNLTYIADANYVKTSGYDDDGKLSYDKANAFAENLEYGGFSDWRLTTLDPSYVYGTCRWCQKVFAGELGNTLFERYTTKGYDTQARLSVSNVNMFENIQRDYWTDKNYRATLPNGAFYFDFYDQEYIGDDKNNERYSWFVREGDVLAVNAPAAVPVPGAVWLFGSALIGLVGLDKRNKKQS